MDPVFVSTVEKSSPATKSHNSGSLAPSPRILAYLARQANCHKPNMTALTVIEPVENPQENPEVFVPPPDIVTTPCDPWPRPYYLEDGLRKVRPYHFTYNTYCKQRWRGRELLDIFATEFRDRPQEYYVCSSACCLIGNPQLIGSRKTLSSVVT